LDSIIVKRFYLKVAKNPAENGKDFLGREPDNKAFLMKLQVNG
jgi:hypothetical protein